MKGKFKYIVLAAGLLLAAAVVFCPLYVQPLIPSSAYAVTATLDGEPTPVELLSPPLMGRLYYIHLLDPRHHRYPPWYGIAFSRQSVFHPVAIYTGLGGMRYIHTDQGIGKRIVPGEIDEGSSMAFHSDGVQFTDGTLSISLHRPP